VETLKFNVFNFLNKSKKTTVPHIPLYVAVGNFNQKKHNIFK